MYYNDGDIMNKKINFKVMAKGYGKASKEVREYINALEDNLVKMTKLYFEMSDRYEKLFNHYCLDIKRISKVNKAIKYIDDRMEEFKNAGSTRKNIKAHHYYMLLTDLSDIFRGEE